MISILKAHARALALLATGAAVAGTALQMQDDGNLVVVYGRTAVWASGTGGR